jgi:hypothetical protein
LGVLSKGALGFGLPLIATPIMLFVLPLPEIVAILALPITIANIQQIWLKPETMENFETILALRHHFNPYHACWCAIDGGD